MVEYGNGVGQVAGQAAGGAGSGGRAVDVGASVGRFVTDSVHTLSTVPPEILLAGVIVLIVGVLLLKRAF